MTVRQSMIMVLASASLLGARPAASQPASSPSTAPRIVSLSGVVTEIIHALGAGDLLVGVDAASTRPDAARRLPRVGSARVATAEAILGVRPTLVIAGGPSDRLPALAAVRAAGVTVMNLPDAPDVAAVGARIRTVADAIGRGAAGTALAERIVRETAQASARWRTSRGGPRVLFVYARGTGTLFASGRGTEIDGLLALAGARPALPAVTGFKPITAEMVAASGAEVLLFTDSGLASVGGAAGALAAIPGLAATPAGRDGRIVALPDDELLWMGVRLPRSVELLGAALRQSRVAAGTAP